MVILLEALANLRPPPRAGPDGDLAGQLERWAEDRASGRFAPVVLHLGLFAWTRMHGVVSLELEGVFTSMDVDATLVFAAEVDRLVQAANGT